MLLEMGVNPQLASMVIPGLYWTPGESDPDSQITMVLVRGVQGALARIGFRTQTNGRLDPATRNAIQEVVGRNWESAPWASVYTRIRSATIDGYRPKQHNLWKQDYTTAIGELVTLGDSVPPKDVSYPGTVTLPLSAIMCTDAGTCYGTTAAVTGAFKFLQKVVGVGEDGKIGPSTAKEAIGRLQYAFDHRQELKIGAIDVGVIGVWLGFARKYGSKPYTVAVYADQIATMLAKYKVPKVKSGIAKYVPEFLQPSPEDGGGVTAMLPLLAVAGIAAYFIFKGRE